MQTIDVSNWPNLKHCFFFPHDKQALSQERGTKRRVRDGKGRTREKNKEEIKGATNDDNDDEHENEEVVVAE